MPNHFEIKTAVTGRRYVDSSDVIAALMKEIKAEYGTLDITNSDRESEATPAQGRTVTTEQTRTQEEKQRTMSVP